MVELGLANRNLASYATRSSSCSACSPRWPSPPPHAAVNLSDLHSLPTRGLMVSPRECQLCAGHVDTLVRSNRRQRAGFRAFNSLKSSDIVYAQDGQWHTLSSITVALQPTSTPPPPYDRPSTPEPHPGRPDHARGRYGSAVGRLSGLSVPACFAIGPQPAKQVMPTVTFRDVMSSHAGDFSTSPGPQWRQRDGRRAARGPLA